MLELIANQLGSVWAGAASMHGDIFTVTDGSVIKFGGIKFTVNGICQNDVCSDDMFSKPKVFQLKNPEGVFSISGKYIENGAEYTLKST